MRNAIGSLGKVFFLVSLLAAPVLAQNRLQAGATPAAAGPTFDLGIGYTYVKMPIPGATSVNLDGIDLSGQINFHPHWGVTLDSTYARTPNVLGTQHAGYLLTFLGGPVFYPAGRGNTRMFVHVLGGMGLVDGAVPIAGTETFHGWESQFSYAAGGGVERPITGPLAVRVSGDYLRSSFFNSAGAVMPQNNLRLTLSLVFRLNNRLPSARFR